MIERIMFKQDMAYTISMNHHSSNYPKAYGSGWYSVISF